MLSIYMTIAINPAPFICLLQLVGVLNGDYDDVINSCTIIDCRYPYEYEAGHIEVSETSFIIILSLLYKYID